MPVTIHLPYRSPTAQAWRAKPPSAGALPGGAVDSRSPLPLAATVPPPLQAFKREEAQAHAEAARAQSQAVAPAAGAPPPGERAVQSNKAYATRMAKAWADKDAKARAAGVDLRKSAFINKLIGTGAALIMLGAAAAATALTMGAASPFLAIAITRTTLLVGDSFCAWADWQRSKETPPRPLPLGANCVGNAIHHLAKAAGCDGAKAKSVAKVGSGVLMVGLASAGLALGMPDEGMSLLTTMLRYTSSSGTMIATSSQAKAADRYDQDAKDRDRAKVDFFTCLMEMAASSGGIDAYRTWCAELQDELKRIDPDGRAFAAFDQLTQIAWAVIQQGKAPVDPVDGDRSTTGMRAVNDILGLQAGANFTFTAVTHGGAMGALGAALGAG